MTSTRSPFLSFFVLACCLTAIPVHAATTNCSYSFISGSGVNYLNFCVTANGNITLLQTSSYQWIDAAASGSGGEGYGICNESPAQNYTDYAVSDTGNWNPPVLVSKTSTSVKIARTTSDGNWTLAQTISKVAKTASITVVMALRNNQPTSQVAYLVRFADPFLPPPSSVGDRWFATGNGAMFWFWAGEPTPSAGLQLQNTGVAPFAYQQGFVQLVPTGPNACAFAYNAAPYDNSENYANTSSIEMAYVGPVAAGQTKTVTLTYRGL